MGDSGCLPDYRKWKEQISTLLGEECTLSARRCPPWLSVAWRPQPLYSQAQISNHKEVGEIKVEANNCFGDNEDEPSN